jgi:predicted  nucleic acid-binding Zn-ribbon protein
MSASIISTMSQPFKLYRLQQIDSQLDRCRSRLHEIEIALAEDAAIRRAQKQVEVMENRLQGARKSLKTAEQEVQTQRLKIEQSEATLYGGKVRNPKELQDLHNESAALRRYLSTLEDRQLEAMIRADDAEKAYQEAMDKLEEIKKERAGHHATLLEEQANLQREVARLEVERQAASASIAPDDLHLYEQLREQRSGVAVAKVSDNACAACGSTLSAALLQSARSPNQLTRCATCGRILYKG